LAYNYLSLTGGVKRSFINTNIAFFSYQTNKKKALFSLIFSTPKSHIFDPAKKAN
jgi:hypothetical protein